MEVRTSKYLISMQSSSRFEKWPRNVTEYTRLLSPKRESLLQTDADPTQLQPQRWGTIINLDIHQLRAIDSRSQPVCMQISYKIKIFHIYHRNFQKNETDMKHPTVKRSRRGILATSCSIISLIILMDSIKQVLRHMKQLKYEGSFS